MNLSKRSFRHNCDQIPRHLVHRIFRFLVGVALGPVVTFFALSSQSMATTETIIYSFPNFIGPSTGLVMDKNGVIYGALAAGGFNACGNNIGCGQIYSLTPPAVSGDPWTFTDILEFDGADGEAPLAPLLVGPDGGLFGTTYLGGATWAGGTTGEGTVFHLAPPAVSGQPWTENILRSFTGQYHHASRPATTLISGNAGVLYGASGTVFQLTPPSTGSGAWIETDLVRPLAIQGNVIIDAHGVIYGAVSNGSTSTGSIFSLTPPAVPGGPWTLAKIYSFQGAPDGAGPNGIVFGANGSIFGSTNSGGTGITCTNGCGTIFELTPPASPGGSWTETVLNSFNTFVGGAAPNGLVAAPDGTLYGETFSNVAYPSGSVFQLAPPVNAGGSWTFTTLHAFPFGPTTDGALPMGGLLLKNGVLYGATVNGGAIGGGAIFSIQP